jgi:hypothetical protein
MERILQFKALNFMMLFVLLLSSKSVQGQVLFSDDFLYSGNLTSNGWLANSGAGSNPIATTSGLSYNGYAGSGIGNAVQVSNLGGEDDNITFASQNTNGQSVYFSFLVNVNDVATTKNGDYFFMSGSPGGATWTAFAARVFAKITAGNVYFGISNTSTATYGTSAFAKNTTYLLVIKYTIATGAALDPVSLWVIPTDIPQNEVLAGTPELVSTTTNGTDAISAIGLRQGSATNSVQTIVDGIRVGLSWADILPSAAPTITGAATTTFFTTTFGTASAAQQFPVSGSNLTADLIATAPTGFEVSNNGTNYNSTATFSQTAGAASGTLYIRLSANAAVGTTIYDSQNIVLSSTGATAVNITTPASGNSVANAALQNQTISFNVLMPVTYGVTPFTVNASASSGLTLFTYSSSNPAVATVFGNTVTVVGAGSAIITASQAGNSTYNPGSAQQTLVVNQKPVTIANASANNKVYDGTNTAVLSGNLTGIETADLANVSVVLTGTFATLDVADGIAVTSTSTLSGTAATNYLLTQPTGLSANITIAPQAITFSALAPKVVGEPLTLSAFSSTSSVNPISYTSSNPSVAIISGSVVTILATGTTTITASQGGSDNYAAAQTSQILNVQEALAKWTFETPDFSATPSQTPALSVGTLQAEYGASTTGSEFSGYHANANTVWSTPTGNASSNSFSSNYWSVGDYLQFKVASQNFYNLSVSFDQTGSSTGPRDFKFQYSTDGINFTDFGADYIVYANASPNSWSGATYYSLFTNTINLNSISALNNLPFVYFRIVNTTTTSISNATTALTGTNRVDNFTVTGTLCPTITPTFSLAPATSTCISNITAYTTQAGQSNYVWTIPGVVGTDYTIVTGGQSVSNSVAIQWLTVGPKTVTVSYTNSNGCISSVASTTTTIEPLPTFTVTNPAAVCAPATVNLNSTVSNTALSYQFYTDANASTLYSTPTAATAGTYYIIGGNGTCYTAPQAVTVTINALPIFTVTNPAPVCAPAMVNLNSTVSNTALSYQFYTDANATTLYTTPTAATAGTYYIIGGNGSCYTAPQAVTVTVNALPTFTVANPAAVCAPSTVNLNSTVSNTALSYQFYTDANATTLYTTPATATAGTYYIIGGNGSCYTAPQAVTVTVNPLPIVAVITGTTAVDVNANTTLASTTPGGVWSSSNMAVATVNPNGVVTGVTQGTATIYYTVTTGGCSGSQSVLVTVNALAVASFDSSALVFYPNPTQDVINFTYKDFITEVEVYNVLGQKVLQTVPNATSAAVNVSNLAVGTYLVKLFSGVFFTTVRILKN